MPTPTCRLLCASASAYTIRPGNPLFDPALAAPYYAGAQFTQTPTAFLAGDQDIDACLVGPTTDGVVVAFRGTLPIDGPVTLALLLDWAKDFDVLPVPGAGLPGQVHQGFLNALDSLWPDVSAEVRRQLAAASPGTRLFITGHSKGGAVAALAAMRFRSEAPPLTASVVTFAAPKVGDADFANAYNAVVEHTRYEFGEDIIPHLPISTDFLGDLATIPFLGPYLAGLGKFNYARVGSLIYITRSLQQIPDPNNTLLEERRQRILRLILLGHAQQIGDDHRSGCGYGYMSALCPDGVCPPPVGP